MNPGIMADSLPKNCNAALFKKFGLPEKVLECGSWELPNPGPDDVLIRMLYSPINPADFGTVMGVYGIKRLPPAVGGNEGVGEIEGLGVNVKGFKVSDKVALIQGDYSWSEYVVTPSDNLIPLSQTLDVKQASMLAVNPMTTWRLLKDYISLDENSLLLQNAANSSVGVMVNQICSHYGWTCVNIVRREEAKTFLEEMGYEAYLESEMSSGLLKEKYPGKSPLLALNAVGGKSALLLIKLLGQNGTLVTYGGADGTPVRFPTRELIFSNIQLKGFWRNLWLSSEPKEEILKEYSYIQELFEKGILKISIAEEFSLKDIQKAVRAAGYGSRLGKILLKL